MAGYTFKQYDSRWGRKNYNGSSTMAAAGCGPTSCADLIYAIDSSVTPWTTALYMKKHGYAVRNAGTAWAGIPACLKAFGMLDVKENSTMSDAFKRMAKGYMAVILFRGGTRGGVTWTTGGHYVAATDYKVKDGKHYLYMRDPGGRDHDGWYCYETTMKGLIPCIWTCTYEKPKPKIYNGKYPSKPVSKTSGTITDIKRWQNYLCWWGEDVEVDGKFGNDTKEKTIIFQKKYNIGNATGVCGEQTINKAKEIGKTEKH